MTSKYQARLWSLVDYAQRLEQVHADSMPKRLVCIGKAGEKSQEQARESLVRVSRRSGTCEYCLELIWLLVAPLGGGIAKESSEEAYLFPFSCLIARLRKGKELSH